MKVYISGISGTGMGPLALMAKDAGFEVFGSDLEKGAIYDELKNAGIEVSIGQQDGKFFAEKLSNGIDWFVYTSALPENHPELKLAEQANIKCTKRDDFTNYLISKLNLKLVAVAGTHGKTTTTAMIVWTALKLGLPVSYVVGTTLGFAPSGGYHKGDQYFIYEADEYDKNFLKFSPWLAVVTNVSYDHPDIYKNPDDYKNAFQQFLAQSDITLDKMSKDNNQILPQLKLAGKARREDALKALNAIKIMTENQNETIDLSKTIEIINEFPGVGRRFEKIHDGVYSDYAHHPEEIEATIEIAKEEANLKGFKGVVAIYEPHQNTRQHKIKDDYKNVFLGADAIYWLPTYLTREDPNLPILSPEDLAKNLTNENIVQLATLSPDLEIALKEWLEKGYLILLMTAGPADQWLRRVFEK